MFNIIKEKTSIVEVLEKELQIPFKKIGDHTFAPETEECPFCGHHDCFRVKDIGDGESFYHCFSCEEHGDVISFISKSRDIKLRDAALGLAKDYKIQLPNDYSPIQDIFNLTALYYHTCLTTSCNKPYAELNKLTPIEYQTQLRRHKQESLEHFKVGWSDGGLVTYLRGLGFEEEILLQTGLVNRKGQDFFPAKVFIYPHYVNGRVSHFTFKDPLKLKEYQLKNSHKLNNHIVYNVDSIKNQDTVIVVEGENDVISVHEAGWKQGIIGAIGQISSAQLEWVEATFTGKNVITIFDIDDAGNKYRDKVGKLRSKLASLIQVKLTTGAKDIDEYLVKGGSLSAAIASNTVPSYNEDFEKLEGDESDTQKALVLNIIEQKNAYYKIRYKDGQPITSKLTNFTIKLRNVFIKGLQREREVILIREDGKESQPVIIDSDTKVSLKPFKSFVANAIDGSYYGQEMDLIAMWEYIYSKGMEREVYIPLTVGRLDEFNGWLFRDCFITDTGIQINPDEEGIIWINNKNIGIKPVSLDIEVVGKTKQINMDIPQLITDKTVDEREDLIQAVVENLSKNLGDTGMALTLLGWAKANVYSNEMFQWLNGFPFLFLWGRHGKGKTVISKWIAAIFNTDECGYANLPQFKSGVGFSRKIAYYSSLPVIIDEVRADSDSADKQGTFRAWYQRSGRSLGTKDGFGIREQRVRSNFVFAGQDLFTDSAARQRCIAARIPANGREPVISYNWMLKHKPDFPCIGYHWIVEASRVNLQELYKEWDIIDKALRANRCEERTAKNWACVAVFAKELAEKYIPKFNYMEYLMRVTKSDAAENNDDNIVDEFFSIIEGLQVDERSPLNGGHIRKDGHNLYIWFEQVIRIINSNMRSAKEEFSRRAILEAIKEESYFVEHERRYMGMNERRVRVLVLDLRTAPESVINIGQNSA